MNIEKDIKRAEAVVHTIEWEKLDIVDVDAKSLKETVGPFVYMAIVHLSMWSHGAPEEITEEQRDLAKDLLHVLGLSAKTIESVVDSVTSDTSSRNKNESLPDPSLVDDILRAKSLPLMTRVQRPSGEYIAPLARLELVTSNPLTPRIRLTLTPGDLSFLAKVAAKALQGSLEEVDGIGALHLSNSDTFMENLSSTIIELERSRTLALELQSLAPTELADD